MRTAMLLAFGLSFLLPAWAQDDNESILVDVSVNYGVAYRDGSWVPVDVFIRNTERDVQGSIEIRTRGFNGEFQSPAYRLPAESPRQSTKRFRLYCNLDQVDSLEARLYHGNRNVLPGPVRLQLTPIDRNDYIGLVLDDTHHDYGFLSDTQVIGSGERRFHREGLTTEQLGYLADHLSCYTNFDIIVMGNIDPERIAPAHRELIRQYVTMGGTLAINLGANADRYKGSWVEAMMGVGIGANAFQSEPDLAQAAFNVARDSAGLSTNREGMVTMITAQSDGVTSIGGDYMLGAMTPVGHGRVVTFTVDAVSGLMIHQPGYLRQWNLMLQRSIVDRPLHMDALVEAASNQLPRIAGVRLFPVSSVITYLLLYFFIAIVANWLFWNKMKRREMAWVCLVFFSLAFTSYAMIFGTQGRARTTQLEQLEVLEVTTNNTLAVNHALTGLLAKGSGRFDATLIHPGSLLSDAASQMAISTGGQGGLFQPQSQTPFEFVQSDPAKVYNLAVGASEMRFVRTETPITLDGAIESDLIANANGIVGSITNRSGLRLSNPTVYFEGRTQALHSTNDQYSVDIHRSDLDGIQVFSPPTLAAQGAFSIPEDSEPHVSREFGQFLNQIPALALREANRAIPPCLLAWVDGPPFGSVDMGSRASLHLGATLIVAWLDVRDERVLRNDAVSLPVLIAKEYSQPTRVYRGPGNYDPYQAPKQILLGNLSPEMDRWTLACLPVHRGESVPIAVSVPKWLLGKPGHRIEFTVIAESTLYEGDHLSHGNRCTKVTRGVGNQPGFQLALLHGEPQNESPLPTTDTERVEQTTSSGITYSKTTLRLDNWESLVAPRSGAIQLKAESRDGTGAIFEGDSPMNFRGRSGSNSMLHHHAYVVARIVNTQSETVGD